MGKVFAEKPWEHEDIFNPNPKGAETGGSLTNHSREISNIQVQ